MSQKYLFKVFHIVREIALEHYCAIHVIKWPHPILVYSGTTLSKCGNCFDKMHANTLIFQSARVWKDILFLTVILAQV